MSALTYNPFLNRNRYGEKMNVEKRIKYEKGIFFVLDTGNRYAVQRNLPWHSNSDSEYSRNADGLSIAIARCDYLHERNKIGRQGEDTK